MENEVPLFSRMEPANVCKILGACAILLKIALSLRAEMEDDDQNDNTALNVAYLGPEDGRAISSPEPTF